MTEPHETISGELIKAGVEVIKTAYGDALQPVAQEAGRALGTVGKAVNIALAPLRGLVWSWERIESYLTTAVEERLLERRVPVENIVTPDPDVAVPAIEALRYSKLRDTYANLLATAMDSASANIAHPSFVEVIKQLTQDEAKILKVMANGKNRPVVSVMMTSGNIPGEVMASRHQSMLDHEAHVSHPAMVPGYLDNLCRLGLVEIPAMRSLANAEAYAGLEADPPLVELMAQIAAAGKTGRFDRELIRLTDFGTIFIRACVVDCKGQPADAG